MTELRNVTTNELPGFARVLGGAFGRPIPESDVWWFEKMLDLERTFCCFDGGTLVATSGNFTLDISVPGGRAGFAGITMVTVQATHRRRGLLNRMMRALIDDARERGEPLAGLFASEESIYQRYGFGLAADQGHIDIERSHAAFLVPPGRTRTLRPLGRAEALEVMPGIYERVRGDRPGMLSRSPVWWETHRMTELERHREGGSEQQYVAAGDDGYVIYRTNPRWSYGGLSRMWVHVEELVAADPEAEKELWGFVLSIDLAERVRARYLPSDLSLKLTLAEPRRLRFEAGESLWLRLVDVEAALAARTYRGDAAVVIGVTDAFCPWNEGAYRVSGSGAQRTDDAPQLELDAGSLAAVYLGEFGFHDLRRAGRVTGGDAAVEAADGLFATPGAPWCPENF